MPGERVGVHSYMPGERVGRGKSGGSYVPGGRVGVATCQGKEWG